MSRHAKAMRAQEEAPPPVAELPPEVLVVARATTYGGDQCVAALLVRGRKLTKAYIIETCQDGATADRSWREWAWRLLRTCAGLPPRADRSEHDRLRTARGLALVHHGKTWGAVLVAMDAEGMEHTAVGTGATKGDAWDELERHAALHLLEDERRAKGKKR